MTLDPHRQIAILGGGPAGLAWGFYAAGRKIPFKIYEASSVVGGNARTLSWDEFRFDTGAHRFHDKIPDITADVRGLLGEDLLLATAPSQIVYHGNFVDFPLSPLNLAAALGPRKLLCAIRDFARSKFGPQEVAETLEGYAVRSYGRTIADEFLLGYSEKLWGAPAAKLLPQVSGQRLKGLSIKTLFVETLRGARAKTAHLDGQFLYPKFGIGQLMEKLAVAIGEQRIQLQSKITRIAHRNQNIHALEINQGTTIPCQSVLSTLPINILVQLLDPLPPPDIIAAARSLSFRHVLLVTLFLQKERVTPNASLYFPNPNTPITRVSEPKNRSPWMAPSGFTSLCAEIPCSLADPLWLADETKVVQTVISQLSTAGVIRESELMGHHVHRIPFAYPILEIGSERAVNTISNYLQTFNNLRTSGRNGLFEYTHIHDLMAAAKSEVINLQFTERPDESPATATATRKAT